MADTLLTSMAIARYYMERLARRDDEAHFQELWRTVAYAIDPAAAAYRIVQETTASPISLAQKRFWTRGHSLDMCRPIAIERLSGD